MGKEILQKQFITNKPGNEFTAIVKRMMGKRICIKLTNKQVALVWNGQLRMYACVHMTVM
ncbi:hypothetical protein [Natranaerobius trueperi]|uniref:hypothetical protein n=1 Tax=Natranaerobius trueperi TaxID=759412 RepID=UPI0013031317|nr:hypothetical protein [Natranaerobius trueperi]